MAKTGGIAADRLKQIVARIERLHEDRQAIADDIKEVYAEAKGAGFDTKIIKKVIALRRLDQAEWQEQDALLDLYLSAIGMQLRDSGGVDDSETEPAVPPRAHIDSRAQAQAHEPKPGFDGTAQGGPTAQPAQSAVNAATSHAIERVQQRVSERPEPRRAPPAPAPQEEVAAF